MLNTFSLFSTLYSAYLLRGILFIFSRANDLQTIVVRIFAQLVHFIYVIVDSFSLCNRCSCCPCAMTTALRTTKQKAINSARPPIVRRFTKPAIFLVQHEFVAFSHVLFLLFFRSFFQIPSSKLTKMILNIVSSSLTKIVLLCSTAGFI